MPAGRRPAPRVPLAERVYGLMLLAYPSAMRRRYGREMLAAFRLLRAERPREAVGAVRFWLFIVRDWAASSRVVAYGSVVQIAVALSVICWMAPPDETPAGVFSGRTLAAARERSDAEPPRPHGAALRMLGGPPRLRRPSGREVHRDRSFRLQGAASIDAVPAGGRFRLLR